MANLMQHKKQELINIILRKDDIEKKLRKELDTLENKYQESLIVITEKDKDITGLNERIAFADCRIKELTDANHKILENNIAKKQYIDSLQKDLNEALNIIDNQTLDIQELDEARVIIDNQTLDIQELKDCIKSWKFSTYFACLVIIVDSIISLFV